MSLFSLLFLFLSLLLLLSTVFAAAECITPPVIFNYGDSNSDTGGARVLMPQYFKDGDGIKRGGRVCDGRLIVDFLCESLKMNYLTPYLQSEPNFLNGANFAMSGSIANSQNSPFNLNTQVFKYIDLHDHSLQLGSGLGEDDFRKALYMLDIGQNDLRIWFDNSTYDEVLMQGIPSFITNIGHAMQRIYEKGGRKLWIHNTGPLGCLPALLRQTELNDSDVDEHGCIASRNRAATEFNSKLRALCEELRLELPNSTIVYVDIYAIKLQLLVNYSSYGFEQPCCGKKDVSWDGFHYSEAANSIVASMILSTNFSSPPLPFNFFCVLPKY